MRQIMTGDTGVLMDTNILAKVLLVKLHLDYFNSTYMHFVGEGYGLLEDDYETIRHEWKIQQLQSLMPILSNHTEEH